MGFKRKFNKGDKAIVKETKQVVTVGSYINRDYRVRFEDGSYGDYRAEKLEKYEEEPALFKVGDRVKYVSDDPYDGNDNIIGKMGTVVNTEALDFGCKLIGVEFDEDVNGHSCNGKGKKNHCWDVPISRVEKVKTEDVMPETDNSKEEDWRVGDEVVVVREFNKARLGMKGAVIAVENNDPLVEFEQPMRGHDGDGRGRWGHCWWMNGLNRGLVKRIVKKDECAKMPTLESGMLVKLRDGRIGLIVENARVLTSGVQKFAILLQGGGFCYADEYVDGKTKSGNKEFDIVEVWAHTVNGKHVICSTTLDMTLNDGYELIWEREIPKKVISKRMAEKELSEKHGVKVVIEG